MQLFQLCGQLFPFVGAGVAQGFGVEQTADFAAVLHDVQRFEQVRGTGGERRIHDDCGVFRGGAEGQKVIMHHPKTVFLQHGAEVAGKLDAVKLCASCLFLVVAVNLAGLIVVVDVERQGMDLTRKRSITGGRFKNGFRVGGEPGFYFPQGENHIKGQAVRRGVEVQGIVWGGHRVNLFSCFVICPAECWAVGRGRFVRCGPARASGFVSGVELVAAAGADEAEPGGGDLLADRFGPAGALGFPAQVLQCPLLTDDLAGLFKDVVKLLHDFVLLSYHANRRLHTCCISSFAFIGAMSTETAAFFGSTVSVARMGANGLLLLW